PSPAFYVCDGSSLIADPLAGRDRNIDTCKSFAAWAINRQSSRIITSITMSQSIPSQRILVIDDEWSVRNTLRLALTFETNTVELATDGRAALHNLAKQKFDIVF